ncbi:Type IV conjugative transfer system protein TraL, proteobacteria [Legionella santicrucis]|uniref:Type IV conjugative transfer system protein TraL, proteobacteria n=1 Tax=Legionella santicrucis TaxID=45074 RepID=A0A0W0ZBF9_9GAMM|nr:type IV conjugative transfer system protein TraL [Legionella santicrucis]KTD66464.1 Type IV conjugative transfer system protein TraL, proteobacteria [Legionella santicrucis]
MENEELFLILRHLDEPKRILGLTLDDCIIGGFFIFLAMLSSLKVKIILFFVGVGLRMFVRKMKKGNPPSYLLLMMYWYFPHSLTKHFLKGLPPSHQRYWIS